MIAGLYVSFILAFTFGGIIWPWRDGRFIATSIVFVALTAAFALTQHYAFLTTKHGRLFPCEFLGNLQLVLLFVAMAAGASTFGVGIYLFRFSSFSFTAIPELKLRYACCLLLPSTLLVYWFAVL